MSKKIRNVDERRSAENTLALRRKLLEKYDYVCISCGIANEANPPEIAHIVPLALGGDNSVENLVLLCPTCHQLFDREPREHEFVSFLGELLKDHPGYRDTVQNPLLDGEPRYRADLLSRRADEKLLIECKSYRNLTSTSISDVIVQLKKYQKSFGKCGLILAVPATLKERDLSILRGSNIEVWDLNYIADNFAEQINGASPSYYKALLISRRSRTKRIPKEKELANALSICKPGKAEWPIYQSLAGDILEHLFSPPLGKPIPELSDKARANRRDLILPNYTDNGFWAFMRTKYEADYIVVDAKNYSRKIKKSDVLQMANYLKPHGSGLFALILSREGGDSFGCEHTLREQWIIHRKLILVLDDEEIEEMLVAKSDGRKPEDILGRKIERFRLSM